ncbi:MAG TPA: hypothetical protein VND93_20510, partial [Myxococcales bacterium]|nr:hypothetical protein [Myxococcales bacterium]
VAERTGDADLAFLAARAAPLLGASTATQAAVIARMAPFVQSPPELRAPVPEPAWRQLLLHPGARGPLGEVLAMVFECAGEEYGARLGDFKLHPKKHAVDLAAATHPALRHLAAVARAMGSPSLNVFSTFLAVQSSGLRTPHPEDSTSLRVIPTVPFSLVVGEKFLTGMDRAAQSAAIGHALAQMRPELAPAVALGPERLALLLEATLSLSDEGYASRVDPKVLKAERKRLEKAMSSSARATLVDAVRMYRQTSRPDDLDRYLEAVRLTPLRAALLAAGDFTPVLGHLPPEGPDRHAAVRVLTAFALGGDLSALRQQTQSQLVVRR